MSEHNGLVFEVPERRRFSYQNEGVLVGGEFFLCASDPTHLDTHVWREDRKCRSYRLRISNYTGTCVLAELLVIPS
jgi:hypothetical protein